MMGRQWWNSGEDQGVTPSFLREVNGEFLQPTYLTIFLILLIYFHFSCTVTDQNSQGEPIPGKTKMNIYYINTINKA